MEESGKRSIVRSFEGMRVGPEDIFIALMGSTGSGKSTLISKCTDDKDIKIGGGLEACTQRVEFFPVPWTKEITVHLIDTPGFGQTRMTDTKVLQEITASLISLYSANVHLNGIIYLQSITEERGSSKRSISIFRQLCGEEALKNVVIATTMWNNTSVKAGERREAELKETSELWGEMIARGSSVHRYNHPNRESAMDLIKLIARMHPVVLRLQKELFDDNLSLRQSGAGKEVEGGLKQAYRITEKDLRTLKGSLDAMRGSYDERAEAIIREKKTNTEDQLAQIWKGQQDLVISIGQILNKKEAEEREEIETRREHRLAIADKLVAANTKHDQRFNKHEAAVKLYEGRNAVMAKDSLVRAAAGPSKIGRWTVSMTMFGDSYWFDAHVKDFGTPLPKIPNDRMPSPSNANGNRCVAFGEDQSWYINYRQFDEGAVSFSDHSIASDNFGTVYPGAHKKLNVEEANETPLCISLGMQGHFFVRTPSGGVAWHLPPSVLSKLGSTPDTWQSIWLGKNGAFVAQRPTADQSTSYETIMDLKGYDPFLGWCIQEMRIKIAAMALNPVDDNGWVVLWIDGTAIYSRDRVHFKNSIFENFCSINFGTRWNDRVAANFGEAAEETSMKLEMMQRAKQRIEMLGRKNKAVLRSRSRSPTAISLRSFTA